MLYRDDFLVPYGDDFSALYAVDFRRGNYQSRLGKHAVPHEQGQTALIGAVAIRIEARLEISGLSKQLGAL
jgi:hypothetical protein